MSAAIDITADVLLAARGSATLAASAWGVFIHAQAGAHLAERIGKLGFLARELLEEIPALLPP
jgi:ADP-dependent NAD(P)H-hydrate dehydratase